MTLPPTIPNELLPTQADYDVAEAAYREWLRGPMEAPDYEDIALLAATRSRLSAEAAIVAWLRDPTGKGSEEGADWAETFADTLEQGKHRHG